MQLVSFSKKPAQFDSIARSDVHQFRRRVRRDHYVYQGNFAGFTIWDVSNPAKPVIAAVVPCITSQGDPSIVGNLLFVSAEGDGQPQRLRRRAACRTRRITWRACASYDVSNPTAPQAHQERADVQRVAHAHRHPRARRTRASSTSTCRGSRARGRRRSSPAARTERIPRTRRTRCIGSTSSRCRSRIPSRPRW